MPDPRLKSHPTLVVRHLTAAGAVLAARQEKVVGRRGNIPPWPDADEVDYHGTLAAIWIWARHERLSGSDEFAAARAAAWAFVEIGAKRFVPDALDSTVDDEAAYDCALTLIAGAAEAALGESDAKREAVVARAARVLATHLGTLEFLSGREFRDPGLLAYALVEYARGIDDRGLLAAGRKFVERAFGMKAPAPFANEPAAVGGLFDFSSTTATRLLAVIAAEGTTPFVGAWLRERIAASVPPAGFIRRKVDEVCWNACVAWFLGRAYVVSTDPAFLKAYSAVMEELNRRDRNRDGAPARAAGLPDADTLATFYYALAVDALVSEEAAIAAQWEAIGG